MAETFYTILTDIGKAKIATAAALGTDINIAKFAVGDGNGSYYNPTENQISLKHEVWRGNATSVNIDPQNPNWIVCQSVITTTEGGFMIREVAIFDTEGDMIAVGKYPETYKPLLAEGSAKDLNVKMIIEVSNASTVTLKVNPSVLFATKEELNALAGTGRTTETVKKNANDIAALAGAGRTTETVKGNADAIANLRENFDEHKAKDATETQKGHIQLATAAEVTAGTNQIKAVTPKNLKTELDKKLNIVDLPPSKDVDNGRYQADFGLEENIELKDLYLNNRVINLFTFNEAEETQTQYTTTQILYVCSNNCFGQRYPAGHNLNAIRYVSFLLGKIGSGCDITAIVYDITSNKILGSKTLSNSSLVSGNYNQFTFDSPIKVDNTSDIIIYASANGGGDTSNCWIVYNTNGANFLNTSYYTRFAPASGDTGWDTGTPSTGSDLAFKLGYGSQKLTGTATKTVIPTDLKKWGNVKVTAANLGANNSATVTVKSSSNVQLKAPVTLVNGDNYVDISDINSSTYPSLKVVLTLIRNSTSDASPTVSDFSVTWEGQISKVNFITGTVSDQAIIPQTPGYKNYLYFVSPKSGSQNGSSTSGSAVSWTISCFVDQLTRVVTAKMGVIISSTPSSIPITANYLEIAWN